jgi:hypothetical protein
MFQGTTDCLFLAPPAAGTPQLLVNATSSSRAFLAVTICGGDAAATNDAASAVDATSSSRAPLAATICGGDAAATNDAAATVDATSSSRAPLAATICGGDAAATNDAAAAVDATSPSRVFTRACSPSHLKPRRDKGRLSRAIKRNQVSVRLRVGLRRR